MADDNILFLAKEFKSLAELKKYAEAQYNTINSLTQRIENLKEENEHLKTLLQSVPISGVPALPSLSLPNEQLICEVQINILKEKATRQELTYEETKKLEIFTKILKELETRPKRTLSVEGKTLTDAELLSIAESKSD